jgi:hypothetical protein
MMSNSKSPRETKEQQLANALRKNLARRKAQHKARADQTDDENQPKFRDKPVKPPQS